MYVFTNWIQRKVLVRNLSQINIWRTAKLLRDCMPFPFFKRDIDCKRKQHDQVSWVINQRENDKWSGMFPLFSRKNIDKHAVKTKSYIWIALFLMITHRVSTSLCHPIGAYRNNTYHYYMFSKRLSNYFSFSAVNFKEGLRTIDIRIIRE